MSHLDENSKHKPLVELVYVAQKNYWKHGAFMINSTINVEIINCTGYVYP